MFLEKLLLPLRRWYACTRYRGAVAELDNHTLQDLGLNRLELNAALGGCGGTPVRHDAD